MGIRNRRGKERQEQAFWNKVEEYSKLTLEELRDLYNDPTKRLSSTYRKALVHATEFKLQKEKQEAVLKAIEESKQTTEKLNESVEPLVSDVPFEEIPVQQEIKEEKKE